MLTLNKLSKKYHSKSGHVVHAIDDINVSFPESGIVFILGASGSGKSTLLNIIGGLDQASSGEMKVYDKSFSKVKEKQLNQYRNRYVGFIFQDFNLINDITIYDNLTLTCFASTLEEEKMQIAHALNQVGLQGYELRYPSEVSGGEFQRIAIARALLKDCKILLADEPSGNLNSELSKQVFDTLKTISATRLVIVVTHNEELAKQYGERIIRLKDGKVVSDSQEVSIETLSLSKYDSSIKNKLTTKIAFKIANKTIVKKKVRMFFNFLALVLGFSLMVLSYAFAFYDRPYVDYRNIIATDDTHFVLGIEDDNAPILRNSLLNELKERYEFDYIRNNQIDSIQKLIEMGYHLKAGYEELTYDGIIINTNQIDEAWNAQNIYMDDQGEDPYTTSVLNYEQIIGKYILLSDYEYYRICGIINSPSSLNNDYSYDYDRFVFYNNYVNSPFSLPNSKYNSLNGGINIESRYNSSTGFTIAVNYSMSYGEYKIGKEYYNNIHNGAVINQNGIMDSSSNDNVLVVNQANGVYISLNLYNQIFDESWGIDYYVGPAYFDETTQTFKRDLRSIPTHIGSNFSFRVSDILFSEYRYEIENYQILGVIMSQNSIFDQPKQFIVQDDEFNQFEELINPIKVIVNIESISRKDLLDMFRFLYQYQLTPYYSGVEIIKGLNSSIKDISFVTLTIGSLALLSILLSNVLFINQSLKSREKEIAILKSIGIQKADINLIFLMQVGIISLISWILTCIISMGVLRLVSYVIIHAYNPNMYFVVYHPLFTLYLFGFIFVINFISTILSIVLSTRRSVIYSLRNN